MPVIRRVVVYKGDEKSFSTIHVIESFFVFLCIDLTMKWGAGGEKLVTRVLSYHTVSTTLVREKKTKEALTPSCKIYFHTYQAFLFCLVGIVSY